MKYIDLSVPINQSTPVYPGDLKIEFTAGGVLEKDGYLDYRVCIGTHVGTHIDAPAHMVKNGKNLDEFPIENFIGDGVYVEIKGRFSLEAIKNAGIKEGDIVLFHTGMSDMFDKVEYFVERGVKMVGMDMCSPDYEPYAVHKILLGNNILIAENLTNLAQLKGKKFKVFALPLKLQVDGAPTRVIASIF